MRESNIIALICMYNTLQDRHKFHRRASIIGAVDVIMFTQKNSYRRALEKQFKTKLGNVLMAHFGPEDDNLLDIDELASLFAEFLNEDRCVLFTKHSFLIESDIDELCRWLRSKLEPLDVYEENGLFSIYPVTSWVVKGGEHV